MTRTEQDLPVTAHQPTASPAASALSRRQLLKALAASGGAVTAASLLPGRWAKPVVHVGCLPAFAQTSPTVTHRLYWAQQLSGESGSSIYRATMEGTDIEPLVSDITSVQTIRLDAVHGKIYWGESGKIRRANLDGSNDEDFVDTVYGLASAVAGIALDPITNRIYWTEPGILLPPWFDMLGKLRCANLDGSGITELLSDYRSFQCNGLAVDSAGGKIYWSQLFDNKIQRSDLDGSNVVDIVTGLNAPEGIALDLTHGMIYWADQGIPAIQRANLDGSNIETLVAAGLANPFDIALDLPNGKMYWADFGTHKIQRANLDGSGVEDVVTSITRAISLALDLSL